MDWYSRRFVETHVNYHIFNALPVPRPEAASELRFRVIELAGRLACPDDRFQAWAKAIGVKCGPMKPAAKEDHIAELDAVVAHLFGLAENHLRHIFETFHEGWDFGERLAAVLEHFKSWSRRR
ncbi:MAG: hypothetical protein K8T20_18095 [Planctomycetes bacterium]|nr:hypothetical protein [Planctomycetota bacterium]